MVDWSELPKDLLFQIGKHLETHFDVLHFRSVCPTWRASVPLNIQRPSFSSPVLIYTNEYGGKFSLLKRTVCLLEFPAEEESSQTSTTTPRFLLAMLEEDEFGKKHILDPLLMVKLKPVRHPEILLDISKLLVEELGHEYVLLPADGRNLEKLAYIDANINGDDHFMVLAKDYDNRALSLIKSGDKELTVIQKEGFGCCVDFIQFKHKFYAVDDMIATVCIEPLSEAPFLVAEGSSTYNEYESFLVESCGKLLLVKRFGANPLFSRPRCPLTPTIRFEVFQLDEERKRWVLLESLGDRILFLGGYCNFSAPAIPGVEGNCILFNLATAHGARVFDLSSGTTVALDHRPDLLQLFRPPSFW